MTKTIQISVLKQEINSILELPHIGNDEKKGLCHILEKFLLKTKNYKGYTYNELFTADYHNWRLLNPDKSPMEFVKHEYNRTYI